MTEPEIDMERRKGWLQSLTQQIVEHNWERCSELYFRITYGLPAPLQTSLASLAINAYLPIFERKWPTQKWPRQLLEDVEQWVKEHGRQVPDEPDDADPADAPFLFSLDGILLAASYPDAPFTVTSACAAAVDSAINARQTNVWMADDPEAVEMWRNQEYLIGRSVTDNAAAIAVQEREWRRVAAWLEEREVWNEPSEIDESETEEALARWIEIEMLFTVPRS